MTDNDTTIDTETSSTTIDTEIPETNWAPTRASIGVALLGTVGGVIALSVAVGVWKGGLVAGAGAVCLAVALWLLTWTRWRVPATVAASLLLVPAGAGIAAGVGYESLVAFAAAFPASSPTGVAGQSLRIIGSLAVLWGCTLAVFGTAASVRGVVTTRTLSQLLGLAVRVALLPAGFFLALAGRALVTNLDLGAAGLVGELVSDAADWLFAPEPGRLHLLGFWLLLTVASYATYRALRDLPTQELAGEATIGGNERATGRIRIADLADALQRNVGRFAALVVLGLPPALLVTGVISSETLRAMLSASVYELLVGLTTAPGLRTTLGWLAFVAGALAGVATLVRGSSRSSTRDLLVGYAPFLAGMAVVAGVGRVHRRVLDALVGFVAGRLEPPLSGRFRDATGRVAEFYGPETIVLGLTAGVLVLAVAGLFALSVWFTLGFVADRVAGASLAGGGLFLAAAFAGTVGASLPVVLGGLVVALVVWDAGEFATTLGEEVGRLADTRRVELLHSLGSLAVGVLATLAAAGLVSAVSSGGSSGGTELGGLSVALVGAVAGVVVLVMALR